MAEKKREKYMIRIGNELIDVSEDIYLTYYRMRRRERFLKEKESKNGTLKYSELDTEELLGIEMLHQSGERTVEETVSNQLMAEELHKQMSRLDQEEQEFLIARYWRNLSQKELALQLGVSQQVISYREKQILKKLKTYLKS